jgi:3',5'-cyclic AMP phosphodiesterase CpdA
MADPLLQQAETIEDEVPETPKTPQPPIPSPPDRPFGKLWSIGDIHLSFKANREALQELRPKPNDGLILVGDVGESSEHLTIAFSKAKECFKTVWWCPGNHELYTLAAAEQAEGGSLRGEAKYLHCVEVARAFGVITPEDPYEFWWIDDEDGNPTPYLVAPIFTLYDYSFRPDDVSRENALAWAKEENIEATDEVMLHPDPYDSRDDWCDALVSKTADRLREAVARYGLGAKLIIANHWPLRHDLVDLWLVPRFSIWCGTKKTEDWHTKFNAEVVVSGHLHVRRTDWRHDVRFEECSLGYPKQWKDCRDRGLNINDILREILPGKNYEGVDRMITMWRRFG